MRAEVKVARRGVAPLCPRRQPWEVFAALRHKSLTIDCVERIGEVGFEEDGVGGAGVALVPLACGVVADLGAKRLSHSYLERGQVGCGFFFDTSAQTLGAQST